MTYWNLIERYGADRFARDLAAAGGAGAITPDLTPDEAAEWFQASDAHGLDRIFLVSPSSSDERIASTVAACRGWVYATSVMGVTGARAQTSSAAPELVARIRAADPEALVGVGLGVSNGVQAREVTEFADAVIVGSALVKTLLDAEDAGEPGDLSRLRAVVADLAAGVREGRPDRTGTSGGIGRVSPVVTRTVRLLLAVGLLLVVPDALRRPRRSLAGREADPEGYLGGTSLPDPYAMPDVSLTDAAGQSYNLASSPSKPVTLLFFGYTNCPDVCIAVLSDLALALQRMEPADRDQIQVVFVTTDPARDKPRQIRTYLRRFNPDFIGLTGSLATIKQAASQVGVDIEGMEKLPSGGYDVGHSAHVIGFSRNSGVVVWTPGSSIGSLKHDFALLVDRSR